jgi:hypothetical protein
MSKTSTIVGIARQNDFGKKFTGPTELILQATSHADSIEAKAAAIAADKRLSDSAKAADRKALAEVSGKRVGGLQRDLMKLYSEWDSAHANLAPRFPDVSEPMMLALAARLVNMSGEQHAKLFGGDNVDPRIMATVFGMPEMLTGVAPGLTAAMRQRMIEQTCAPELAELAERKSAIELAQSAVQSATDQAIELAGHGSSESAAKVWMAQFTGDQAA